MNHTENGVAHTEELKSADKGDKKVDAKGPRPKWRIYS